MAKVIDPVCGMEVDTATAQYKTVYKGRIYYFCSHQCKVEFERNPEYYLTHGPKGMPGESHGGHGEHGHHHEHGHEHHHHSHGHHHHHGSHC